MEDRLDAHIRKLREFYWSDADPEGRGFVALADLYRRVGDLSEARRLLRDGVERHPDFASGHVVLGWVLTDQGKATEAESSFRAALALDQRNLCSLKGLGVLLMEGGKQEEALGVLQELLLLDPGDEEIPIRIRELQEALKASEVEDEGEADGAGTAGLKATEWGDGEKVAGELDWESAAVQRDESRSDEDGVEVALSDEERAGAGQAEEVSAEVEVTRSLDDALATRTMGEIYLRQGLLAQAKEVFQRLLEADPGNVEVRSLLEEVEARGRGEGPKVSSGIIVPIQELAPDEPGAVPVESLAPDAIVPIQELAPDEPGAVPAEVPAPDAIVPIQELAPDEPGAVPVEVPAPDAIVPIRELAPDEPDAVPVEVLAPDAIVPIQELAPDEPDAVPVEVAAPDAIVPIQELAPDEPDAVPVEVPASDTIVAIQELAPDEPDPLPVESPAPEAGSSPGELTVDEILPVGASATEGINPVGELAPETVVPIGTLAPDFPDDDPRLDDFEAWLESF